MSLLIIGKLPLPIGGVTIHVKRLLDLLKSNNIDFLFYDLKKFTLFSFFYQIKKNDFIHLHSSSPFLHLLFCLICKLLQKVSIITFHGDIGRFGKIKNYMELISIHISNYPIVLNPKSYNIAKTYNPRTILMSAYIPPIIEETLDESLQEKIANFRLSYEFVFSTNAYNYSIDSDGNEIYGITDLINFFTKHKQYGFIISDPSGNYHKKFPVLPLNIFIINYPHSFQRVLDYTDCFIRYTSTDGDSLSIHEALDHGVSVIATDVVARPHGVQLVPRGNVRILQETIDLIVNRNGNSNDRIKSNYFEILDFYKRILK